MKDDTYLDPKIEVVPAEMLAETVVLWLKQRAVDAINIRGVCHIALSGGSTPKAIYRLMASDKYRASFEWEKIKIYFGDERTVPHDHPDSNYKMAMDALMSHVPIPSDNIFAINTQCEDYASCAEQYQDTLKDQLPVSEDGFGCFDVVLLGMGDDGHTASLFPGTAILNETQRWVSGVFVEQLGAWRISITFPIINHARNVAIVVAGEKKSEKVYEILSQKVNRYPIEQVSPQGECVWFLDNDAANSIQD